MGNSNQPAKKIISNVDNVTSNPVLSFINDENSNLPDKDDISDFSNVTSEICLICNNNILTVFPFKLSSCNHVFCPQCLCNYLETFNSAKITCPLEHCNALIPDRLIRKCLTNVQTELYDKLCLQSTAVKCLVDECSNFVALASREDNFICPFCKQPNCVTCSNLHEENEPCGPSSQRKSYEERARINLVEKRRLDLLEMRKDNCLDINPESSECLNCTDFLLPREGILVIPCMHNFCRKCLQSHLTEVKHIDKLTCLNCESPLENGQLIQLIGTERVEFLSLKNVEMTFFRCQTSDCTSFWDIGDCKTSHTCPMCHRVNCIPCHAVHEGQSCKDYRKSDEYQRHRKEIKTMKKLGGVYCYNCNNSIIKAGGCGALRCNQCLKQICAFSGKALGPNGCKCRNRKKCHKDCDIGCIPEGESKEEEELKKYFYND